MDQPSGAAHLETDTAYGQPSGAARLEIDAAYYNSLDIRSFALMLKDPSYCYKFYWLEAIVNLISEGVVETTFNEIIDEMICKAYKNGKLIGKLNKFHLYNDLNTVAKFILQILNSQ